MRPPLWLPLVLRLVQVKTEGKNPMYLLTSVHSEDLLTDTQVAELYRLRWGVEVMYGTLRRTLEHHKASRRNNINYCAMACR